MAQLLEITPEESASHVRAKLAAATERDVILLVPRDARALRNQVGAKVLARAVVDLRLHLAVVTRDPEVRRHVSEAGISVFGQVNQAEAAKRWRTPPDQRPLEGVAPQRSLASVSSGEARSWPERLLGVALVLVLLVGVGAGTALLIPEAEVRVRPARQSVAVEVNLAVLAGLEQVDYERVAIPGRQVTTLVQGTWSQPTTSRVDSPDQRATGRVLFINQSSGAATIPAGTIVSTGAGVPIRFRTTEPAQLPGQRGGTAEAPVEAVDPGPQGNVGAYLINTLQGPLGAQVTVVNENPTQGGTVRQTGVVTETDREQLRNGLLQRLESEAHNAIQNQLRPGDIAPRETLVRTRVFGEGFDRMLGEPADQLTLTLRAEYAEMAFSSVDANLIALAGLQGAVPAGYRLTSEGLSFEITGVQAAGDGSLVLTVIAEGTVAATFEAAEVRGIVQGLTPREAEARLGQQLALAEPARVSLSPDWMGVMPQFGFRIRVVVEN